MKKSRGNKFYAQSLFEALKGLKPGESKEVIKNFVAFLVKNHKIKKAAQIVEEFEKIAKAAEGIRDAKITLSRKVDEKTIDKIKNVIGAKIEEKLIFDEGILGGFIVEMEDKIIDASLKTQLQKLKQSFN